MDGPTDSTTSPARSAESAWQLLLLGMAAASGIILIWQSVGPHPAHFAGLTVDRLSAVLTLLVALVGVVTYRYSARYLQGERGRERFLRWLAFTVVAAYLLMLCTNLLLLFAAWLLTSGGLHALLTHYQDRLEARRPARKKFLISRLGDVALVLVLLLVWRGWGTLDLHALHARIQENPEHPFITWVGVLVVLAAMTKSAQFPFHSWLPETMEAPTPVSALMHAGIINAGGALLLRFAPMLVLVPAAQLLLVGVGTLTFAVGMLAMWAQVKVKRTLAWSTVSQMGFMMVQCGLATFPAALLHIVGHGCYKAWSFLRSGQMPAHVPQSAAIAPGRRLTHILWGVAVSVPCMGFAAWVTGFSPWHSSGEFALSAILALAVGQLWATLLEKSSERLGGAWFRVGGAAAGSLATVLMAFALYQGATKFFAPVFGDVTWPSGPTAWVAAIVPVAVLAMLTAIHAALPWLDRTPKGRAWYVHALHGFYVGAWADCVVDRIWSPRLGSSKEA